MPFSRGTLKNITKRAIILVVTLVVAMYITIIVANAGGYIDELIISQIRQDVGQAYEKSYSFRQLPLDEQHRLIEERVSQIMSARGLDQPFIIRSFIYLIDAMSLGLGRALWMRSAGGSSFVRDIIFERTYKKQQKEVVHLGKAR